MTTADDPLARLIETYHELNIDRVDELQPIPTAVQFLRHVASNRPFVIRGGAATWTAFGQWDAEYLRRRMSGQAVNVAVTPSGNADAIVEDKNGNLVFVEPHEVSQSFDDFLHDLQIESKQTGEHARSARNVRYAQTQNDNLRHEYLTLYDDVPADISFATEAFDAPPDAINLWLGTSHSTTSLHKDNYENIYAQIRGSKHFTLLPPCCAPCVNETPVPRGRYRPIDDAFNGEAGECVLEVVVDTEQTALPVPVWDPAEPEKRATKWSELARPLKVTLGEGDLFYLPAMWYHMVEQSEGEEGFVCSVNYWYDMDFAGGFWSANAFVRDVIELERRQVQYPTMDLDEMK